MKYFVLLAFALFGYTSSHAFTDSPVSVKENLTGLTIIFKNPELTKSKHLPAFATIPEAEYVSPDSNALQRLLYTIAIPKGSRVEASVHTFRFKNIDGFKIDGSVLKENYTASVKVIKLGIQRGVELVNIEFQPYQFDKKSGKLSITDSAVITVNFNNPAEVAAKNTQIQDVSFFKNVVNQAHLQGFITKSFKNSKNVDQILKAENTWYDATKQYARIATTRDGVAKISVRDVLTAIPNFTGRQISKFHLIFKGEEYPFAFVNDNNGIADENDEIIFLGKRAAGDTTWFDTYTKEAVFYLTYDESSEGNLLKDFSPVQTVGEITRVGIQQHVETDKIYNFGDLDGLNHSTEPVLGEGFFWKTVAPGDRFTIEVDISSASTVQDSLLIIAKCHTGVNSDNAKFRIVVNGKGSDTLYSGSLRDEYITIKISSADIINGKNQITVESYDHSNSAWMDYVTIEGKVQSRIIEGKGHFIVNKQENNVALKITGLSAETAYAIDNTTNSYSVLSVTAGSALLPLKSQQIYNIYIGQGKGVELAIVDKSAQTTLLKDTNQADLLIITHNSFKSEAQRLAEYRAATRGVKAKVVDVEDIFKEFDFGRHSPIAIKNFLKHAYSAWQKPAPKYVVLVGDASWDARKVTDDATETDFIPVYGNPVSDYWYTLLEGDDALSEMYIGRFPVSELEEARNIVDKLIEYDTLAPQPWMKKFMGIAGGYNFFEAYALYEHFSVPATDLLTNPSGSLVGEAIQFSRYEPDPNGGEGTYDKNDVAAIGNSARAQINDGTLWVSYAGHGSPNIMEVTGWESDKLTNGKRYFFLTTFSCRTGSFAEPIWSINERFINESGRGAIATLGTTGYGYIQIDQELMYHMFMGLSRSGLKLRELGELVDYAKRSTHPDRAVDYINTAMQYSLLGDPMTRIPIDTVPDLYLMEQDVKKYTEDSTGNLTIANDTVYVELPVRNNGINYYGTVRMDVIHNYNGKLDTIKQEAQGVGFKTGNFRFGLPIKNMPGTHRLTVITETDSSVIEQRKDNNSLSLIFEVYEQSPLALDPLPFWAVNSEKPIFRIINPFLSASGFDYEFSISEYTDVSPTMVVNASTKNNSPGISPEESYIEWTPDIQLTDGNGYLFNARLYNRETQQESNSLQIPFTAMNNFKKENAAWSQHTIEQFQSNIKTGIKATYLNGNPIVQLEAKKLSVQLSSAANPRFVEIKVDDIYHYSDDISGIALVVYSPYDMKEKARKFYTMWDINWPEFRSKKLARELTSFINSDTVAPGDYVLVSVGEDGIRGAIGHAFSDRDAYDSLTYSNFKEAFHSIGSQLIDSVREYQSFALFGRKGMKPGEATEVWNGSLDTLTLNTELPIYQADGWLATPLIGPAQKWDSISISGVLPDDIDKWKWKVTALHKNRNTEQVVFESDSVTSVNLSALSAQDYPFLKTELFISKTIQDQVLYVDKIHTSFIPEAEIAVLSSKTGMAPNTEVLRGDTVIATTTLRNISLRGASSPAALTLHINADNGSPLENFVHQTGVLKPDEIFAFRDTIATTNLTLQSNVRIMADKEAGMNELYAFNNTGSYQFKIMDDSIPPVIELFVDGKLAEDRDLIQRKPAILIRIWDNSRLATISSNTEILVNSMVEETAVFTPKIHRQIPRIDTVAEFTFIPNSLEAGENSFNIYASDATGNNTHKKIILLVSMENSTENIKNSPNPFSDGTTFSFTYKGQELSVPGNVEIHNISGQKVRDMDFTAELGETTFFWDGRDNIGRQLPAGMYFYKIQLRGLINTESAYGKCVIVR